MFVNYKCVKGNAHLKIKVKGYEKRSLSFLNQGRIYLGLLGSCCFFVLLNNFSIKYNAENWCEGEEYKFALDNLNESGEFMSQFHYALTLMNVMCYSQAFGLFSTLCKMYEDKINQLYSEYDELEQTSSLVKKDQ